ncbi:MAG: redoxin domain-containing protein [Elusimicrobia bacterium]|nr:redoxin domain-containing protein [Elusimicrobiota bacterium]
MILKLFFIIGAELLWGLEPGPYPGQRAPDFELPTIEGKATKLSGLYQKNPVWLTLYTTWCPECNTETPALVEASQKHQEVQFISVSLMEDPSDVEVFRRKFQVPYPMLLDEEGIVVDRYKIRPIPVNIGIAQGGEIIFRRPTVTPGEVGELLASLNNQETLAAGAISVAGPLNGLFASLPLLASLVAGMLTFLSPCILPLIPAYFALITGFELEELTASQDINGLRRSLIFSTLIFIFGFGAVFTAMGATASAAGRFMTSFQDWLRWGGGLLMIIFGLHVAGVFQIMPFYREMRFSMNFKKPGPIGAFLLGMVFAAGWTPCVGPVLSAILIYSASEASVSKGAAMLVFYSLGVGIPFLISSFFIAQFQRVLAKVRPHYRKIEIGTGTLLAGLGVLLMTNRLAWLVSLLPSIGLG